jgi:tRNA uridine 5-carbamoylmethylation protein Kti12
MKLIILHGPPASGKLTLANHLKDKLGYNVLHNHLTVDLALEVYSKFGADDFYDFVDKLRSLAIEKACINKMKGLIVTFCFESTTDMKVVEQWETIVSNYGGKILPIYLNVSSDILAERVTNTSRVGTKKIQCPYELNIVLSENEFGAISNKNTISIDTSLLSIDKSVSLILERTL